MIAVSSNKSCCSASGELVENSRCREGGGVCMVLLVVVGRRQVATDPSRSIQYACSELVAPPTPSILYPKDRECPRSVDRLTGRGTATISCRSSHAAFPAPGQVARTDTPGAEGGIGNRFAGG